MTLGEIIVLVLMVVLCGVFLILHERRLRRRVEWKGKKRPRRAKHTKKKRR